MSAAVRHEAPHPPWGLAILAAGPLAALLLSPAGRGLLADDLLLLKTLYLPAASVLVVTTLLLSAGLPTAAWTRRVGLLHGLAGALTSFEAARVLSTLWLLLGRGLLLDAGLGLTLVAAGIALLAGVAALAPGARAADAPRHRPDVSVVLAGLGLTAVPLLPWFLLQGETGAAVLLFNDLTDPAFSEFPQDPRLRLALWSVAGGLAAALALALGTSRWRGTLPRAGLVGLALAWAVVGHVLYFVRAGEATGSPEISVWPGINVLPALAILAVAVALRRERRPAH